MSGDYLEVSAATIMTLNDSRSWSLLVQHEKATKTCRYEMNSKKNAAQTSIQFKLRRNQTTSASFLLHIEICGKMNKKI